MKKSVILIMVLLSVIGIMFLQGCGGPAPGGKQIKVFEVSGGVAYMPDVLQQGNGIVLADSSIEIGDEYVRAMPNDSEGEVRDIEVCLYVNGVKQPDIIELTKDFSGTNYSNSFELSNITHPAGGGTKATLTQTAPGECKLVATCSGVARDIDVFVYDSFGVLSADRGRKINLDSSQVNSSLRSECAFFSDAGIVKIVGKSYLIESCDQITWREKLKNVKTVNTDSINSGNINNVLDGNDPKIYVAEVPGGGYMKIVRVLASEIWEYTSTVNFK